VYSLERLYNIIYMLNKAIKWAIYLLVFLLPLFFLPFSFEKFELNKAYLLFFLVSLAFLAWLAKMIIFEKQVRFKKSPLDVFVLAFFFIAALSVIFSVDKFSSLFGFYGRFSNSLIGLFSFCLLYFLITNNVGNKKESVINVQSLIKVFSWSVFFVVLISYFSIFGVFEKINSLFNIFPTMMLQSGFNTVTASMEGLAVFLSIILVFLIGRILIFDKGKQIFDYLLFIAITFLMVIIDFNATWLIVFLSLIIFLVFVFWKRMFKKNVNKLLLPILFVILAVAFIFINTSGIQGLFGEDNLPQEQFLSQGDSWFVGLKAATENVKSVFLGSGIGTFHYDFAKFKPLSFNQNVLWQIRIDRPGNYFAEVLGTTGFLGIISYLLLIGLSLLISFLFLGKSKKGMLLLMLFLAILVSQFFYYQNAVLAFTFWLVLGLSAASWHSESVKEKTISFKDFPEMSLVFSILLIVVVLLFLGAYFFAVQFYLADVNYKKGIEKASIELVEKAVRLNPYQSQYGIVAARYYLQETNMIIEEEAFDGNQLICNASLALAYVKGGEVSEICLNQNADPNSLITIKGAEKISPNKVFVQETLGMIYRDFRVKANEQEALKLGIQHFEKAVNLEPINPILRTELGKLYFLSGDIKKAEESFNKAIEVKPDYFEAFFEMGRLYLNDNQIDKAIAQFETAIQIFPDHSNSLYFLGLAYQENGQTSKALTYYNRVLELNPGDADVISKISSLTLPTE